MVSGLMFKPLIYFELIFVYGVRLWSSFILLYVAAQFSQHHLLKRLSFPHCIFLAPLSLIDPICVHLFLTLYSIPVIYVSVFMPGSHYFIGL